MGISVYDTAVQCCRPLTMLLLVGLFLGWMVAIKTPIKTLIIIIINYIIITLVNFSGDYGKLGHGNTLMQKIPKIIQRPFRHQVLKLIIKNSNCLFL